MNAVEIIEANLDVESILAHYDFNNARISGNYIRSSCRLHEGDNPNAFVINLESGLWACHTGDCGKGNIIHLIQKLEECNFPRAIEVLAEILKLDLSQATNSGRTKEERKELRELTKVIQMTKEKKLEPYVQSKPSKKVKKYKAFDLSTIEHFGLRFYEWFEGASSEGKRRMFKDVLAFPIIQEGILVGYSLRATRNDAYFKWIHQPPHISTGSLLYNYENVIGEQEIVVVEGITDVWAYYEIGVHAVCTYGAKVSETQKQMLLKLGCDLVFSFDGDEAGIEASRKANDMFKLTSNIKFVKLPYGKDPEAIPREELKEAYEKRTNRCV